MPIITQTLNIDNLRITSAKSVNLHSTVKYSLKNVAAKAMFTPTVFKILISEDKSVLSPAQRGTGSERVNVYEQSLFIVLNLRSNFSKEHFPEIAFETNRANRNVIYESD